MKVLAIARNNLVRMFRDRSAIFFIFIFPLALILLIGLQFGGSFAPRLGVLAPSPGTVGAEIIENLGSADGVDLVELANEAEMVEGVERGSLSAALTIPADFDQKLAAGDASEVGLISRPGGVGAALRPVIGEVVQRSVLAANAAGFVASQNLAPFDEALLTARMVASQLPAPGVTVTTVGESLFPATLGRFDIGASSQLVLFMFVTALSGAAVLIQTRELGLSRRMLATPTSVPTIITGEASGRFLVVAVQGLYIMAGALLIFGVDWGDPLGALAIVVVFSAVGAGAAMLLGTIFRNAEQAGGVGVIVGLGMAALGGAMLPIQLFSPTLQRVAHLTPHAWALDGFAKIRDGGGLLDIGLEISVLAAYALVLLLIASWRLRRVITRP
ncbi:MAG: ABC transporter permease [Acidimicrobiia bacterium]